MPWKPYKVVISTFNCTRKPVSNHAAFRAVMSHEHIKVFPLSPALLHIWPHIATQWSSYTMQHISPLLSWLQRSNLEKGTTGILDESVQKSLGHSCYLFIKLELWVQDDPHPPTHNCASKLVRDEVKSTTQTQNNLKGSNIDSDLVSQGCKREGKVKCNHTCKYNSP